MNCRIATEWKKACHQWYCMALFFSGETIHASKKQGTGYCILGDTDCEETKYTFPSFFCLEIPRSVLSNRNRMQITNAADICNFKFSSNHIKKKHMKFSIIFSLTQYSISKILSFQQVTNIKILRCLTFFFLLSIWNPVCILYCQHISIWTRHISSTQ